jgi:uncharacterized protein (DUF1330 family)
VSSYFLALIDVRDPERYEKYLAGFDAVFEKFEGRVVSVEDNPLVLEGEWPAGRTVLIRFPDEDELRRWYGSSEYQDLAQHRHEASVGCVAIISGRDE